MQLAEDQVQVLQDLLEEDALALRRDEALAAGLRKLSLVLLELFGPPFGVVVEDIFDLVLADEALGFHLDHRGEGIFLVLVGEGLLALEEGRGVLFLGLELVESLVRGLGGTSLRGLLGHLSRLLQDFGLISHFLSQNFIFLFS